MDAPNFADMPAEDVLTLIENAKRALDQKIAAEKADIEKRQARLALLIARRAGKDVKPKDVKPKTSQPASKPRGRPAKVAQPKPAETAESDTVLTN
jgi:hypothetical protein